MVKLSQKYAAELESMRADAEANVAEANESVTNRTNAMNQSEERLKELKETARIAHKGFLGASRKGLGMAFSLNPDPEETAAVATPFKDYANAAMQVPEAENDLRNKEAELASAEGMLAEAESALMFVKSLLRK